MNSRSSIYEGCTDNRSAESSIAKVPEFANQEVHCHVGLAKPLQPSIAKATDLWKKAGFSLNLDGCPQIFHKTRNPYLSLFAQSLAVLLQVTHMKGQVLPVKAA